MRALLSLADVEMTEEQKAEIEWKKRQLSPVRTQKYERPISAISKQSKNDKSREDSQEGI